MKTRKSYILLLLALTLAFLSPGCLKVDTMPQLEIQVLDESGGTVSGAYVGLFESQEEWINRDNPAQVWRKTSADGKVLFVDLKEVRYYIYVRFDGKDNSLDEFSTFVSLSVNKRHTMTVHIR